MSQTDKGIPCGGPVAVAGSEAFGTSGSFGARGDRPADGASLHPYLRHGIGVRLLMAIILFSGFVTLLSTLTQLYLDYLTEMRLMRDRFGEIETSSLASLGGSLWSLDTDQLRLQAEGIKRLPDIQYVEIRELGRSTERRLLVAVGEAGVQPLLANDYHIIHGEAGGGTRSIGVLHVEASLSGMYGRLIGRAVVILVSQGVKTFLVALFILYIVHRLVTRHLAAIAEHVGRYRFGMAAPLVLDRPPQRHEDELDRVVGAFNAMSAGIDGAYLHLSEVNAELANDIAARIKAEEEVRRLNAHLEQRVQQRTAELEASNRELDAFTYSVSHDLRAPLRRIEGFGQLLNAEAGERLDEQCRHYLERIRAGTREMAEMTESFLKLARSSRSDLIMEPANLADLAAKVITRLREREPDRIVSVHIAPAMPVTGDRRLLDIALENLLGNSWKYTRPREAATIAFAPEVVDGVTRYVIRDNGVGFDMAHVNRLFTPFNRLHRPGEFEGTGIGLATVQRIITRHGGRIWAEGTVNQGATFSFTLWEGSADNGNLENPPG